MTSTNDGRPRPGRRRWLRRGTGFGLALLAGAAWGLFAGAPGAVATQVPPDPVPDPGQSSDAGPDPGPALLYCALHVRECVDGASSEPAFQPLCGILAPLIGVQADPTSCGSLFNAIKNWAAGQSQVATPIDKPASGATAGTVDTGADQAGGAGAGDNPCYQPGLKDAGGAAQAACEGGAGVVQAAQGLSQIMAGNGSTGLGGGSVTPYAVTMGLGFVLMVGSLLWGFKSAALDQGGGSVKSWDLLGEMGIRAAAFIPVCLVVPGLVGIFRDMISIPMADWLHAQSGGSWDTIANSFAAQFAAQWQGWSTLLGGAKAVFSAILYLIIAVVSIVLIVGLIIELIMADFGVFIMMVFFPLAMGLAVDPRRRNLSSNMIAAMFAVVFARPAVWLVMWIVSWANWKLAGQFTGWEQMLSMAAVAGIVATAPAIGGLLIKGVIESTLAGVMGGAAGMARGIPGQIGRGAGSVGRAGKGAMDVGSKLGAKGSGAASAGGAEGSSAPGAGGAGGAAGGGAAGAGPAGAAAAAGVAVARGAYDGVSGAVGRAGAAAQDQVQPYTPPPQPPARALGEGS
jgi:hypothetical protein